MSEVETDRCLYEFLTIVEQVEATPFEQLPRVGEIINRIVGELISEEEILGIAAVLGETDIDWVRREVHRDVLAFLSTIPDFWDSVQRYARTILIFEQFLGLPPMF
jgi:hypothetical protein